MIQTTINLSVDSKGTGRPSLLYLPISYAFGQDTYPLLVFLHGTEEGSTSHDLSKIYNSSTAGGPAYFIEQKLWPSSSPFIVISPQANYGVSTTAAELEFILTDIISKYRIDISRIYLTGLSAGGEGILEYIGKIDGLGHTVPATHKIAAFMPMSATMNATYQQQYAKQIVADNVQTWGFGSPE